MTQPQHPASDSAPDAAQVLTEEEAIVNRTTGRIVNVIIRIGILGVLVAACWSILSPFVGPVVWGGVLAIAIAPIHARVSARLGGKDRVAASLLTLLALSVVIVPSILLAVSAVHSGLGIGAGIRNGTITIPAPPENLAETPVVGPALQEAWALAHGNLQDALAEWGPEIKNAAVAAVGMAGSLIVQVLFFALSILLAGLFLAFSDSSALFIRRLGEKVAPGRGERLVGLSTATMRSVAKGVLGVAVIQALLSGIGLLIAGVPGAGLWALAVLFVAIIQLPLPIVLLPAVIWYFNLASTGPAVVLAIYLFLVSIADTFLKPMLLGRGLSVPMPVILLGAIGGMISMGIIGLFVGAVILALGHTLFQEWLAMSEAEALGFARTGPPEEAADGQNA